MPRTKKNIGKKNWKLTTSTNGVDASAIVYSLIETAKANNLNVYDRPS
ncbi:hypothetical protein ACLD41_13770 [Clostridium botulinum]